MRSHTILASVAIVFCMALTTYSQPVPEGGRTPGPAGKLTVRDIVQTLVSSSDARTWQRVGDCDPGMEFRYDNAKDGGSVYVQTAFFLQSNQPWYDVKFLNGPVLKYPFFIHLFERGKCVLQDGGFMDDCFSIELREVEVVSKTQVRIKRTLLREVPVGRLEEGKPVKTCTCILQKK